MKDMECIKPIPEGWYVYKIEYEAKRGQWSYCLQKTDGELCWADGDTQEDAEANAIELVERRMRTMTSAEEWQNKAEAMGWEYKIDDMIDFIRAIQADALASKTQGYKQ